MQTAALQPSINAASLMLVGTGQDASKIAGEMLDAFGSVDNITASATRRVGHLSTKLGASTVSLPGGQIYENLVSGAIDATEWVGPYERRAVATKARRDSADLGLYR